MKGFHNCKKKAGSILLLLLLVVSLVGCGTVSKKDPLSQWNDGENKSSIIDYVNTVTDSKNENFIPVEDRIAVFDMDGTLIGEHFPIYFDWIMYCERVLNDPSYTPTKEQVQVAADIVSAARALSRKTADIPGNVEMDHFNAVGEVYEGMSIEEFRDYATQFLTKGADCYEGLTYAEAYFRPMQELVNYLEANDFTVYIVSGTDREAVRVYASMFLDLPLRQVIGSDFYTVGSVQGDEEDQEHQFASDEQILRDNSPIIKNIKMSKVIQMEQEIGQQPVLAFGNSSGDQSMFMYTTSGNPYLAAAYCLVPDDDVREYSYAKKTDSLISSCEANGWHAVSMADDFKSIYGDTVVKNLEHTPWLDQMEELLANR